MGPGGSAAVAGAVAVGEAGGGVLLVATDGAAGEALPTLVERC